MEAKGKFSRGQGLQRAGSPEAPLGQPLANLVVVTLNAYLNTLLLLLNH